MSGRDRALGVAAGLSLVVAAGCQHAAADRPDAGTEEPGAEAPGPSPVRPDGPVASAVGRDAPSDVVIQPGPDATPAQPPSRIDAAADVFAPAADASVPAAVELVKKGFGFLEGPVWIAARDELLFSDVTQDTIDRLRPAKADELTVFRKPSGHSNGLAIAPDGSLVACENGGRRVVRYTGDGPPALIADRWPGGDGTRAGRFNAPNDVVVRSDGSIYFTDPDYGVGPADRDLDFTGVFRVDRAGKLALIDRTLVRPNGIALSPDESFLYVAENPQAAGSKPTIWRYPLRSDGSVGTRAAFASFATVDDFADGMAIDRAGNLFASVARGIAWFTSDGRRVGLIPVPERPANCTFGGADAKTLYITAITSLYRVKLDVAGLP